MGKVHYRGGFRDVFLTLMFLAGLAGLSLWFMQRAEIALRGKPHLIDGDSIRVSGQEIRLIGMDAPEYRQTCTSGDGTTYSCGLRALDHLKSLVGNHKLFCMGSKKDRYNRLLAVCRAGDVELNSSMVADGWAVSYGAYKREEGDAKRMAKGLWAGDFQRPSVWRKNK